MMSGWTRDPIAASTLTGAAEITFENLGYWQDLRIEFSGLQHSSGTPDIMLQVGVGGVYNTTDYITVGNTGTTSFLLGTAIASATSVGGIVTLLHFNLARSTWARIDCGREAATPGRRNVSAYNTATTAWNCLKILNSTATNFTANNGVYIFGLAS
jgi:hypothetical protein